MTVPLIVHHNPHCQHKLTGHTDAAKRIADTITMHWLANKTDCVRKWVMFNLSDGRGGMDLFPSKADAVRFARYPKNMLYLCIMPGGMPICEAEIVLKTGRGLSNWGLEDSERQLITPVSPEQRVRNAKLIGG
jgi:hypothetical protein